MHDIIIIGGWASGLFCSLFLPKEKSKLILEKTDKIGTKVLMSWGERCNLSNINIDPEKYVWSQKQALPWLFNKFSYQEMTDFLNQNGIETKIEDNWRILLKSWKSKQMVEFLLKKSQENNTEILTNYEVISVSKTGDIFTIKTSKWEFQTPKLIIATWGKSYPQIGATDIGRQIASQFDHSITSIHPGLCWIETKENLSSLTGNSCTAIVELIENNKVIHHETGAILFTHRGISGPAIFNTTISLWNYLNQKKWINNYTNFRLKLIIDENTAIKKITSLLDKHHNRNILHVSWLRDVYKRQS